MSEFTLPDTLRQQLRVYFINHPDRYIELLPYIHLGGRLDWNVVTGLNFKSGKGRDNLPPGPLLDGLLAAADVLGLGYWKTFESMSFDEDGSIYRGAHATKERWWPVVDLKGPHPFNEICPVPREI